MHNGMYSSVFQLLSSCLQHTSGTRNTTVKGFAHSYKRGLPLSLHCAQLQNPTSICCAQHPPEAMKSCCEIQHKEAMLSLTVDVNCSIPYLHQRHAEH